MEKQIETMVHLEAVIKALETMKRKNEIDPTQADTLVGRIKKHIEENIMPVEYYIFGSEACIAYDEGLRKTAKAIAEGGGITYIHNPNFDRSFLLLADFDGWGDYKVIDKEDYEELEKLITVFNVAENKKLDIVLLINSANGVYIPQHFAELYPERVTEEQKEILMGDPYDVDGYWETWQDVLDNTLITDAEGTQYYLHHDEDLWLVPEGYEFEDFTE